MRTVEYHAGVVRLIDQTLLPARLEVRECRTVAEVCEAIRMLRVRGAPAIGVAAACAIALAAHEEPSADGAALLAHLERVAETVRATRPTAVNLAWGVERALAAARAASAGGASAIRQAVEREAQHLGDEDVERNRRMARIGATLIPSGARILTHCNTGALATVDVGTALGVVMAAAADRPVHVLVDETRPLLQGARLTAWELRQAGVPMTLITDSMAAHFMARGEVDLVMVGADRIAANGDTANKIGTYGLAVLARAHGLPFYVVAPTSTIDLRLPSGAAIPLEERGADEVRRCGGVLVAPPDVPVANPAFDVTPARLITAIVTEEGIASPPFEASLPRLVAEAERSLATAP